MPRAELPPPIPAQGRPAASRHPGVELALPMPLRDHVPALTLWSVLDEPRYRLTCRYLDHDGPAVSWDAFAASAARAGLLDPGPAAGT